MPPGERSRATSGRRWPTSPTWRARTALSNPIAPAAGLARRAWPKQPPAQRMPEGSGQGAARPGPARQSTKGQRPRDGKRTDMNQPLSKIATHPQSARAHERARAVMPGGNTRSTAYESPHPLYLAAGSGPFVRDLDGRRYHDLQNNLERKSVGWGKGVSERVNPGGWGIL